MKGATIGSIRHGILALLTQGPAYGLQLRNELDARTLRHSPLNVGQVYSTLDRLLSAELLVQQEFTPDGLPLYELTPEGLALAEDWFRTCEVDPGSRWESMVFQILLVRSLPGVSSAHLVEAYRNFWRAEHLAAQEAYLPETLAELRSQADETLSRSALSWLDDVSATSDHGVPLSRVRPPRGRPAKE